MAQTTPTLDNENRLWRLGYTCIAGVDEVGRGALAGPVVAGAVALPPFSAHQDIWASVRDSKQLSAPQRESMADAVKQAALAWGIGAASPSEIDQIGIAAATRLAMMRAVAELQIPADYLLIDWVRLAALSIPQESPIKADARIVSVAAASILAKVWRDRWMCEYALLHPDFGFAANKGYGTSAHLDALSRCGPCELHRRSFAPLRTSLFSASGNLE